ncbi:hypothetical protein GP475_08730 [Corynebacterium poyangense]|uniref:Uncharacterized protein n=1 Tax=Corynebacterium poyangense TaxID=2684405 RepID=A0A7H0SQ86_9CORY|nr:hypothetical protein [Corynebacterium poyangense]QNQ90711.1 hypothetical protein GP475_08730 [Corynebacterium poyangense]
MLKNFRPYRWQPVLTQGERFRLTFQITGDLLGLEARIGSDKIYPAAVTKNSAEIIIPSDAVTVIPDRASAVLMVNTGAGWEVLARGHVVKEEANDLD